MNVVYSIGSSFAGGGIGNTAYYTVSGLYKSNSLKRVLCGSTKRHDIPTTFIKSFGIINKILRKLALYDPSKSIEYIQGIIFDQWASYQIEQASIFHVWGHFGLKSIQIARDLDMLTVLECASSHPEYQANILQDEYARWGINFQIPQKLLSRRIDEISLADYIAIPSSFVETSFINYGIAKERLLLTPFGVDTLKFKPSQKPPGDRPFRVLFVGQIGIRKGIPYIIEAWNNLKWKNAELWIVGRAESSFHNLLPNLDIHPGIKFVEYTDNPAHIFQNSDVFVFPTIEEGSALVIYEALASGLPVITTINSGAWLKEGSEGFYIPIRDPQAICTCLENLRTNDKLRLEMGRNARILAENYTWENYGNHLCNHYKSITEELI